MNSRDITPHETTCLVLGIVSYLEQEFPDTRPAQRITFIAEAIDNMDRGTNEEDRPEGTEEVAGATGEGGDNLGTTVG